MGTVAGPGRDAAENPAELLSTVQREAHDWLMRFIAGTATGADLAAFRQWAARDRTHTEAFAEVCRIWDAVEPANKLLIEGTQGRFAAKRLGRRAFIGGALAASVAGATSLVARPPFGLWPSLSEFAADYRTAPGEQRSIALPGGPSLDLNTRTSINLLPSSENAERLRLICGEASVSARPGMRRTIVLMAGNGEISAANAIFNVRYDSDVVRTTCVEGEVGVVSGEQTARLRAGEQIVYSPNGIGAGANVNVGAVTAWRSGTLTFESTPLAEAITELNRYRSRPIVLTNPALGRRLFNARFEIANIDGVVARIEEVFGASVLTLPGGIVLLG